MHVSQSSDAQLHYCNGKEWRLVRDDGGDEKKGQLKPLAYLAATSNVLYELWGGDADVGVGLDD